VENTALKHGYGTIVTQMDLVAIVGQTNVWVQEGVDLIVIMSILVYFFVMKHQAILAVHAIIPRGNAVVLAVDIVNQTELARLVHATDVWITRVTLIQINQPDTQLDDRLTNRH